MLQTHAGLVLVRRLAGVEVQRAGAGRAPVDAQLRRGQPLRIVGAQVVRVEQHAVAAAVAEPSLEHRLPGDLPRRSEEHTSELQSLMRNAYAVFCLKKKT